MSSPRDLLFVQDREAHRKMRAEGRSSFIRIVGMAVSQVFGITTSDLLGRSRGQAQIALARQVAMYLARVVGGMALSDIGREFGRDRTTVAHACMVIETRRDDPGFNFTVDLLEGIVSRLRQLTLRPVLGGLSR